MWLIFTILLMFYLLVKIIKTILEILDILEMRKSTEEMAKFWKEGITDGGQCCEENSKKTQPTRYGKHFS